MNLARPTLVACALALPACGRTSEEALQRPPPSTTTSRLFAADANAPAARPASRKARLSAATNTRDIVGAVSSECLACADKAGCFDPAQQGGVCETMTGKAKSGGRTEADLCLETMRCVYGSNCASTGEESSCLCGMTNVADCEAGKVTPAGPCVDLFRDDFGDNGKTIYTQFINQKFGAGRANWIIQCTIQSCDICKAL